MGNLEGKIAVVTGGNSGIGLAAAKLVITGRRKDLLDQAVRSIGAGAIGIQGDVADPAHHAQVAHIVRDRFDGADIYMANAGVNTITHSQQVSEAEYDAQFAINTRGVFLGVRAIAPVLRDGGSIILTGSLASEKVLEGHAVYAGTKARSALSLAARRSSSRPAASA